MTIVVLGGSTRRFDLYDFFSVLIPGVGFIGGLVPFLPKTVSFSGVFGIIVIVVGGFVSGRALHALAISVEDFFDEKSHRDLFIREIRHSNSISDKLIKDFLKECNQATSLDLNPETRNILQRDNIEASYTFTRSAVHIDGRGRSRTFQAVYAFYRSTWLAGLILGAFYLIYPVARYLEVTQNVASYASIIGSIDVNYSILGLLGIVLSLGLFRTFRQAERDYRRHFVEYLISDFLVIQRLQGVDPQPNQAPPTKGGSVPDNQSQGGNDEE